MAATLPDAPAMATSVHGLTLDQVAARVASGQTNVAERPISRTVPQIIRANVLTRFNLILAVLLAVILSVGDLQDAMFGVVPVLNSAIGIAQELRARRTLGRLAIISAPSAHVVRGGALTAVAVEDVVLDDLVEVHSGDQVVADGVVQSSDGLQVDESLLTGESEPLDRAPGDRVLSGSFVVAGSGRFQATAVGQDAYARRLAQQARHFSIVHSELVAGVNRILGHVTRAIVPVAILLTASHLTTDNAWQDAVPGTVAALVGMVPQGLVLLTSVVFAVAAIGMARQRVLVQELPAVEGLARVDVICFDKTGTLTDGTIRFAALERLDPAAPVEAALGALADHPDRNATLAAVAAAFPPAPGWTRTRSMPFSSSRRWSGAYFAEQGAWVLGAPEVLLAPGTAMRARAADLAGDGRRVLVLGRCAQDAPSPEAVEPVALVTFEERIRDDAAETLAYFAAQGVAVKVISGDSGRTVAALARRAGLSDAGAPVDGGDLPDDVGALGRAIEAATVFGRIAPHQKHAMVEALQARGHTVAMTGDGVNDVLALKAADIGVAMGSGSAATRAVAQLVLLDGRFATLPGVVADGRRVTANVERVANLFITKTVWATLLAVAVALARTPYPLLPRHLTVVDTLSIGIPAFFLALAPNLRRFVPGFVGRVLRFAVPAGTVVAAGALAAYWWSDATGGSPIEQRTSATLVTLGLSLTVLALLARPLTWRRLVLLAAVVGAAIVVLGLDVFRTFFELALPANPAPLLLLVVVGSILLVAVSRRASGNQGHPTLAAARRGRE